MEEEISSFERVVGDMPESEKEKILQRTGECFDNQAFEDLESKEREKTADELKIIDMANEATNQLRRECGMDDFNIPPQNIHVIKEEDWPSLNIRDTAEYKSSKQAVAMREQPARIVFLRHVLHEILHFKSYQSLQVTRESDPSLEEYRMGLCVHTRDGQDKYFTNLNEAITEELTIRLAKKLFEDLFFADEKKGMARVMKKFPKAKADSGGMLFNEDTYYATTTGVKNWRQAVGRLFGKKRLFAQNFTYRHERKIFNTLVDKIFERNPDQFKDREEVFDVFSKGMIAGNILPVGRLLDGSFGPGTLRRIGELDQKIDEQESFVNSL